MKSLLFILLSLLLVPSLVSAVDITDCSQITSDNTYYRLSTDILSCRLYSIQGGNSVDNVTIDLNGYRISDLRLYTVSYVKIINGYLGVTDTAYTYGVGMEIENVTFNKASGDSFLIYPSGYASELTIKNSVIDCLEVYDSCMAFINFQSKYKLINSEIKNLPAGKYMFYLGTAVDLYLENVTTSNISGTILFADLYGAKINLINSDLNFSDSFKVSGDVFGKVYKQHIIPIRVFNQKGERIGARVKFTPQTQLTDRWENIDDIQLEFGVSEDKDNIVHLPEKILFLYGNRNDKEIYTSVYNVTITSARSSKTEIINITGNSVIPFNFILTIPEELPQCTIAQMLDLNNDGDVNAKDVRFLINYIAGRPVSISSTKNCNALNLFMP